MTAKGVGARVRTILAIAAMMLLGITLASCTSSESKGPTRSPASESVPPKCPNPDGGLCRGALGGGTYTTQLLIPVLTYTMPRGWQNFEDNGGNFLLVPPGEDFAGVDAATSDFIGVYTNVWPTMDCDSDIPDTVAHTPSGFLKWLRDNRGFRVTNVAAVTVGGLPGFVADLRVAPTWKKTCPYSNGEPLVPLMTGREPTGLDHNVIPGQLDRLYMLKDSYGVLAIEAVDVHDANKADSYSALIAKFKFARS